MNHLIEPLKNLGLSEKEARVYLALLQLGSSTPYQIAKKAGLKRPTAYVIAEELVGKGLIVNVPGEKRLRYIAKSPEVFIKEREGKLEAAKRILPELKSFHKGTAEKPSILFFEGIDGFRQGYFYRENELHEKKIAGFFASPEDASSEVLKVVLDINEYNMRHKISVRGLTVDKPNLKTFEKYIGSETSIIKAKYLPPELYSAKVSIESCDDKFVRICLLENTQILIIESPKFAEAIRESVDLILNSLEGKYDTPESARDKISV